MFLLTKPDFGDLNTITAEETIKLPVTLHEQYISHRWQRYVSYHQPGESQRATDPDLTVVIPTRNERDNVKPLLGALLDAFTGMRVEIIFVDDSDDETPLLIEDAAGAMDFCLFHIRLQHRPPGPARAGGLATAVSQGMSMARAKYIAVIDADLQHPPAQLRVFYDAAIAHDVDLVLASRYIRGGSYEGLDGVSRRLISIGFKWLAKLLFPEQLLHVSDPLGGFFLLRRSILEGVNLRPVGYKILLEVLIRCQWSQFIEVPYHFHARANGTSKATMRQGMLVLQHMRRLLREVPAAGRIWKIAMLAWLNIVVALLLFALSNSIPGVWNILRITLYFVVACINFVLVSRKLFPSTHSTIKAPLRQESGYHSTGQAVVDGVLGIVARYTERRTSWFQRLFSFLLVGGIGAIVNVACFAGAYYSLARSLNSLAAYFIAFVLATEISIVTNFVLNDRFTFRHLKGHSRCWQTRCVRFHITSAGGTLLTLGISFSLLHLLHITALLAQVMALIAATAFNFIFHHVFTYRHVGEPVRRRLC